MMSEARFYVQIIEGGKRGTAYRLNSEEPVIIGRAEDCGIILAEAVGVSRQHCRLLVSGGKLRLQDLDSQNGVLVEGRKIKEAIINPGVRFKIGNVTLQVGDENALAPAPAAASAAAPAGGGANALAPAADHALGAAKNEAAEMELAEQVMLSASASSKKAFLPLLGLIAFAALALYLFAHVSTKRRSANYFAMVRAREAKVVNFQADFAAFQTIGKNANGVGVITATDYNGLLKESLRRLRQNPRALKRRFLVLRGSVEGNAWIQLKNDMGQVFANYRVLCRGVDPFTIASDTAPAAALEIARRLQTQAARLRADSNFYDAWWQYKRAARYYAHANELDAEADCNNEAIIVKTKLSAKLADLFEEALAKAFPQNRPSGKRDYLEGIALLDYAAKLLPREDDLDRQVIDLWQDQLRLLSRR